MAQMYPFLLPTRPHSPLATALCTKIAALDRLGSPRALKILDSMADHLLGTPTLVASEKRARTIARLRACGAVLTAEYLEQQRRIG